AAHHYYWDKMYRNNDISIIEGNDYLNNKGTYTHDILTQEALSFIKANDLTKKDQSQPFFLYLAYTIPHLAITVPDDSKEAYKNLGWPKRKMNTKGHYRNDSEGNVAYAGMVSRMDRDIGSLLNTLKEQGLSENTLVIFTSDHGHEFDREFFNSNGPFRGKKRALYEGGIRAPFIAWWPETIKENITSDHIFASWDLMATVCELAQVNKCQPSDGISYVPALLGQSQKQKKHDYLYWEFNEKQGPIQAVRDGDWKLVKFQGKAAELYNLKADIGEENNVAAKHPNQVTRMINIMSQAHVDHPEFPLTPVTRMLKGKNKSKKNKNK
ncbi:MAG: sulfatase-like hydrolase/transferase, partial [Gammaproteobacteria bacterium]|nr:sulfatase-like hydrolase/transferase [Gammaproteobacteria bacterium]